VLLAAERHRLDRILGLWGELVDPRVGIIQRIFEIPLDEDDPDFFHYLSISCNTARFAPLRNFRNNGGVSTDRYVAVAKAMGEAIERYCPALFRRRELLLAPYAALSVRATHPSLYALYREDQLAADGFPWQPFTEESPVHWTPGVSLLTGEEVLVPAAMVYLPFQYATADLSAHIAQPISTGLACGSSRAEAILSGLLEVIERDAFTLTWQARMSRPRILPESLPATGKDLVRRFAAVGLRLELMDITTDIHIPTILTIALSEATSSPALTIAAASDPSPERALVKSLEELAHTRKFSKQVMEFTPPLPVEVEAGHPAVQDQRHHLRFYAPQESRDYAAFAWSAPQTIRFSEIPDRSAGDPEAELRTVVDELAAAGREPIVCDLTSPDIAPLGLRVVRSVVPGMHPLFMGHRNRALGGRRLLEVPQKLGQTGLAPGAPDNPYPHPFP